MINKAPLVSVIVPTYNRSKIINRAIDSILRQTYQNIEIIVVDDASQDETKKIVESYEDSRICYLRHKKNRGGSAARNSGIEVSSGEYIAFLDSDDEWLPEKLTSQLFVIQESSLSPDFVYTRTLKKGHDGRQVLGKLPSHRGYIYSHQLWEDCVTETSTWFLRADCFRMVGGFDETLPARQDYDLSLRLSQKFIFEYIQEPLVIMHVDSDQVRISNNLDARLKGSKRVMEKIEKQVSDDGMLARRAILSHHHYAMAMYAYKTDHKSIAYRLLWDAIIVFPLNYKSWGKLFYLPIKSWWRKYVSE